MLGLPAGRLRKPYLNMAGGALRAGLEIVKRLGLVEPYGYEIREDWVGEDSAEVRAPASPSTVSGACFIR